MMNNRIKSILTRHILYQAKFFSVNFNKFASKFVSYSVLLDTTSRALASNQKFMSVDMISFH